MTWTELKVVRSIPARYPLAVALALSLLIHFSVYGVWKMGQHFRWWEHQATWLLDWKKKLAPKLSPRLPVNAAAPAPAPREIPLTFVEVDPAVATPDAPKDAKYYSAQSSRAANPDPAMESVPKIEGRQNKVVRLEDVPKPGPQPLQPSLPPPPDKQPEQPKPKPSEVPGDLAKVKPEEIKRPSDGQADAGLGQAPVVPKERPRTLAAARQQKGMLVGEKMKQDGGTNKRGRLAVDVTGTSFGSYDAALVAAVQQRWYDLLESQQFAQRSGKVILEFRLHSDGRISELRVDGNEVGEILGWICQRAIRDPSPFGQWPNDMLRTIGKNYREVQFTFYYN